MYDYEMIRKAPVTIEAEKNYEGKYIAMADIAGNPVSFPAKSRISRALEIMPPNELGEKLSGGHYFFVNGNLIDFRDSNYVGFIHSDQSIDSLVEHVGITTNPKIRVHNNTFSNMYGLSTHWSTTGIDVPVYKHGGKFHTELHFGWNPFIRTVNSAFMLIRLICTNGMMGLRSFLNSRIPLINRWQEHLEIANIQIQHKVGRMITDRLSDMGQERATVGETISANDHVTARIAAITQSEDSPHGSDLDVLDRISGILDPKIHLSDVYQESVFTDRKLAAQTPAHLTVFDLYNIVTEVRSHTQDVESSTSRGLDMISNRLVFDRKNPFQIVDRSEAPPISPFSDPESAFFGQTI